MSQSNTVGRSVKREDICFQKPFHYAFDGVLRKKKITEKIHTDGAILQMLLFDVVLGAENSQALQKPLDGPNNSTKSPVPRIHDGMTRYMKNMHFLQFDIKLEGHSTELVDN